jgi:hypothetical protein
VPTTNTFNFYFQDPTATNRQIAIRIKTLPKGTVSFERVLPEKITGSIEKEPKGGWVGN